MKKITTKEKVNQNIDALKGMSHSSGRVLIKLIVLGLSVPSKKLYWSMTLTMTECGLKSVLLSMKS